MWDIHKEWTEAESVHQEPPCIHVSMTYNCHIPCVKPSLCFNVEINVPQSGGRMERHSIQVTWSPVCFHSEWWFGEPCHLLVLVHCIWSRPKSTQPSTRTFQSTSCFLMLTSLSPCHTVPKLTPDGHTNMELIFSPKDGPEFGQQPMHNRSKYDAYRRSNDGTSDLSML